MSAVVKEIESTTSGPAKLAERGNPNARLIVEELRKRGVTINPEAGAASK